MMNWVRKWRRPDHRGPKDLPGGRFRTSTVAMVIAFVALSWLQQTYQPPTPDATPETAVVPPGFVPDPQYTWVPRTNVRTRDSESDYTTTTTTTNTTTTSPTESTSPNETSTSTSPSESTPASATTSPNPGEAGSPSPQTSTQAPSTTSSSATTSVEPVAPTTVPPR